MPGFKLGRLEPKNHRALEFSSYARAVDMPVFPPVDYLPKVDWRPTMNGNDRAGDCVACMVANAIHLVSQELSGQPLVASLADVITFYRTQNPRFNFNGGPINGPGSSADQGMDIQTALEFLTRNGMQVGNKTVKAVGFVRINPASLEQLRAACSIFGGLMLGVDLTQHQMDQFPTNAWEYIPGQNIGGHAILGGGHADKAKDELRFECWAAESTMTQLFMQHQLKEAWGVIFPWHLGNKQFVKGMDLATFAADYTAITGKPFPADVPLPVPVPQPVPVPVPTVEVDIAGVIAGQKYKLVRV